jgi:tetrahydromethanopterin:alpha-L-glutamate ligase
MTPAPEILILGGAGGDWHASRLRRAFAALRVKACRLAFADCAFEADALPLGIRLGAYSGTPDAVVVRSIPAGSFEQVTLRLGLLHALHEQGVVVINDARAIERCVDKSMTSFLLARAGLPTPPAWTCESRDRAATIVLREAAAGHQLVLKPLFGSQGRGLRLLSGADELPEGEEVAGVFHLQRFVGSDEGWRDFRVLVVAGRAVAAMVRRGASWITNIRRGGTPEPVDLGDDLARLAVAAVEAVGAVYAGVDLIHDRSGVLQILEVNSMPAWQGLQSVTEVDLAACLARAVADACRPAVRAVG